MYVITDDKNNTSVCFASDNFPVDEFNVLIIEGSIKCRRANTEEKEFCFWAYDHLNKPIANLDGINSWREMKKQSTNKK